MSFRFPATLIAFLAFAFPPTHAAEVERPVRVLIVDGFSNHDWRLTTRSIRAIIEPTGLFSVDVSSSPPTADSPGWDEWRPDFSAYDVVIQNCNDINGGPAWPEPVRDAFETNFAVEDEVEGVRGQQPRALFEELVAHWGVTATRPCPSRSP